MEAFDDILPEIQALMARYLDGHLTFEATVHGVAAVYKRTFPLETQQALEQDAPKRPRRIWLKPLVLSQWMNPNQPCAAA